VDIWKDLILDDEIVHALPVAILGPGREAWSS